MSVKTGIWAFFGALVGARGKGKQGSAGTVLFFLVVAVSMIPVYVRWLIALAILGLLIFWISQRGNKWYRDRAKSRVVKKQPRGRVDSQGYGTVYTFRDSYGMTRYDGSSGDLDTMLERIRAHVEDKTALADLIRPGWTLEVEWVHDRDEAYAIEGERIDEMIGEPGYENRRREGRGRRATS